MGSKSSVLPPSPSNDLSGRRSSSLVSAAPPSSPEGDLERWAWSPPSKGSKGHHSHKSKRASSHVVQHRSRHAEHRHAAADLSEIRIAASSGVSPEGSPTGPPGFPDLHSEEAPPEAPDIPIPVPRAATAHEAAAGFTKAAAATGNAAAASFSTSSSSGFSRSTRRTSKTTSTATPVSVSRTSWTSSAEMADNISDISGASSLFAPRKRQGLDEAADMRLLEARRRATNSMEALQLQLRSRSAAGYAGSSLPRTRPRPAPVQVSDEPPILEAGSIASATAGTGAGAGAGASASSSARVRAGSTAARSPSQQVSSLPAPPSRLTRSSSTGPALSQGQGQRGSRPAPTAIGRAAERLGSELSQALQAAGPRPEVAQASPSARSDNGRGARLPVAEPMGRLQSSFGP